MSPIFSGLTFKISYAWLGLGVLLVVSAILTVIYFYHWRKYGMNTGVVVLTEVLYLIVIAVLL